MTDISVIILVGKEERHIGRCLEKLAPLEPRQIFVVESQKGDRTHAVAVATANSLGFEVQSLETVSSLGFSVQSSETVSSSEFSVQSSGENSKLETLNTKLNLVWHDWPGTQSKQFNWALDYVEGVRGQGLGVSGGGWILRLDADEYLTDETIEKLRLRLGVEVDNGGENSEQAARTPLPHSVAGLTLELKRKFCGGEIKHGTNGIRQVRLFRRGKARYAETLMDERLIIGDWQKVDGEWKCLNTRMPECLNGHNIQTIDNSNIQTLEVEDFPGAFYDDSLMPMSEWREKHRGYAKREAQQAVESMKAGKWVDPRKAKYYRLPPYFRAFVYFGIRYFLKRGFLDGYAGWMWNFWQGLWYRLLVDREIARLRRAKG